VFVSNLAFWPHAYKFPRPCVITNTYVLRHVLRCSLETYGLLWACFLDTSWIPLDIFGHILGFFLDIVENICSFSFIFGISLYTQVREDEISELELHLENCWLPVPGGVENSYGKVNILLQTYISRGTVESFSLTSDLAYVAQVNNVGFLCCNLQLFLQ